MEYLLWLLLGLSTIHTINAAEVLAITPIGGSSHWNIMSSVLEALLNKGHKVTVVTPFLRKVPHENYTEIDVSKLVPCVTASPWKTVTEVYASPTKCLEFLNGIHQLMCHTAFNHPDIKKALRTRRFDVVFSELFASRCDLYLASHLGIPHVGIMSSQMLTWYQDSFDNPSNPSYITVLSTYVPFPKPETFSQRFWNLVNYVTLHIFFKYIDSGATELGRRYFGSHQLDAETILRNVSLVFLNTHSQFDVHKPMATNFQEIGGIHLKPPKPLPTDLQEFIDNAEHGVIYFSLGSVVKMEDLPISIQNGLKEGFAELPQKVLWKLESDIPMVNQPKNVYTRKWFPQYDIIRHPNVKLFITHGGNSGTIEGISAGVPVLGFPIFYDQPRNMELFKYWGSGLTVNYNNFTKEDFVNKIKQIMNNYPRFKKNAMDLSRRFHDRPMSPEDTVTYWTEYVIKHDGAHHLKSHAIYTEWYQYFSLDFIAITIVILGSLLYFTYNIFSIIKL